MKNQERVWKEERKAVSRFFPPSSEDLQVIDVLSV
jgi:hypothetical protein